MKDLVFIYAGNYYFRGNGRWKQITSADYLGMAALQINGVAGNAPVDHVDVPNSTAWAHVVSCYGAPGGL